MPAVWVKRVSDGIFQDGCVTGWEWVPPGTVTLSPEAIKDAGYDLLQHRLAKRYSEADRVRARLVGHGVAVECGADVVRLKW